MSKHPLEQEYPIYQDIIAIIGVDKFLELSKIIGGRYFRWPKLRTYYAKPKWDIIARARAQGQTYQEIGTLVGMTRQSAFLAVKKMTEAGKDR